MARRDWFAEAFGTGVADVRERLMEGWFGKGFERVSRPHDFYHSYDDDRRHFEPSDPASHDLDR